MFKGIKRIRRIDIDNVGTNVIVLTMSKKHSHTTVNLILCHVKHQNLFKVKENELFAYHKVNVGVDSVVIVGLRLTVYKILVHATQ